MNREVKEEMRDLTARILKLLRHSNRRWTPKEIGIELDVSSANVKLCLQHPDVYHIIRTPDGLYYLPKERRPECSED